MEIKNVIIERNRRLRKKRRGVEEKDKRAEMRMEDNKAE
jgi:hypothetical protein